MSLDFMFFINTILLGVGLAMDAFSVSLANGLSEPLMRKRKLLAIAGVFGFFQALMPLVGWACVHLFLSFFSSFQKYIPWIALALLLYIGGNMIFEARKGSGEEEKTAKLGFATLLMQGIATSIDALSVGFTISDYNPIMALLAAIIIAVVTFIICIAGVIIGKKFGTKLSGKANILGGLILIAIGIEIFITGVF
ncbi:MAG: manganese efflux pump [Ruminococcus sp.]|nr:manganese efflux pump [Ruminococcus sp.]